MNRTLLRTCLIVGPAGGALCDALFYRRGWPLELVLLYVVCIGVAAGVAAHLIDDRKRPAQ